LTDSNRRVFVFSDNLFALADIYEGQFEGNKLILSNLHTSTWNNTGTDQSPQKNKIIIDKVSEDEFHWYWQAVDESKAKGLSPDEIPWNWGPKMIYKRIEN